MANQPQLNPLDPLGILGGLKRQVDTAVAQAQVPAALQPKSLTRLLDPLGVFAVNNERPGMDRGDRTSTDRR